LKISCFYPGKITEIQNEGKLDLKVHIVLNVLKQQFTIATTFRQNPSGKT
jgi:hypothetical protein